MKKFLFYWFPTIVWALLIFVFSSISVFPKAQSAPAFLDKLLHFGEYFIFTMLLTRSLIYSYRMKRKELCYLAVAIVFLYAFADEAYQFLVPPRDPDFLDFVSDVIGSAFGTITYFFLFLKKKEK